MHGSIKNGITATEILEERAKCDFDKDEVIIQFYHERKWYEQHMDDSRLREATPELANTFEYYEKTRAEKQEIAMKKQAYATKVLYKDLPDFG